MGEGRHLIEPLHVETLSFPGLADVENHLGHLVVGHCLSRPAALCHVIAAEIPNPLEKLRDNLHLAVGHVGSWGAWVRSVVGSTENAAGSHAPPKVTIPPPVTSLMGRFTKAAAVRLRDGSVASGAASGLCRQFSFMRAASPSRSA